MGRRGRKSIWGNREEQRKRIRISGLKTSQSGEVGMKQSRLDKSGVKTQMKTTSNIEDEVFE